MYFGVNSKIFACVKKMTNMRYEFTSNLLSCHHIYLLLIYIYFIWIGNRSIKISSCPLSSILTCKTKRRKPEKSDWKKDEDGGISETRDILYLLKRDSRNGEDRKNTKG